MAERKKLSAFVHSESVAEAITFDSPQDLRASRAGQVLACTGRILRNNTGSATTFDKSATVERISWFISHNWATPRFGKFMVLAFFFNYSKAIVPLLGMCCIFALGASRSLLPVVPDAWGHRGICCQIFGTPVFLLIVLFLHDLFPCTSRQQVFLDKTCIHQTDVDLKQKGIIKLGAFLRYSSGMLIVYADTYLRKLWTVYELATFLALRPNGNIKLAPLFLPQFFVTITVFYYIAMTSTVFSADYGSLIWILSMLVVTIVASRLTRSWMCHFKTILEHVKSFHVGNVSCFDEADRPVVYCNIANFMRGIGLVPPHASLADALMTFDELVRNDVERALLACAGQSGFPYRVLCSMTTIMCAPTFFDRISGEFAAGNRSLLQLCLYMEYMATANYALIPLSFRIMAAVTSRQLHREGWFERAVVISGAMSCMLFMLFDLVRWSFYLGALESSPSMTILMFIDGILWLFVCYGFRPERPREPWSVERMRTLSIETESANGGVGPQDTSIEGTSSAQEIAIHLSAGSEVIPSLSLGTMEAEQEISGSNADMTHAATIGEKDAISTNLMADVAILKAQTAATGGIAGRIEISL